MTSIAHVRINDRGLGEIHELESHLASTSKLASKFAEQFGAEDWARIAGLWHDLGKFKPDFQAYIRDVTGFEQEEAEDTGPGKVDHTAAGAIHATQRHKELGRILAYLIAGHHSGLPDWQKAEKIPGTCLEERLTGLRHLEEAIRGGIPQSILIEPLPTSRPPFQSEHECKQGLHLWIRMLFSALVDADFLDTEAFMDLGKQNVRNSGASLQELKVRYDSYMESLSSSENDKPINLIRRQILAECREGAKLFPGFFSLSVPTGGGKTLASMGFALDHAIRYRKQRIIMAIPFTSIIEQTAETLRKVFGENAVLEHHSNLDPDQESIRSKLASENWDAPIIVTTNVQLFESLFASRTSSCRKLHNIVDSVIILDEAQVLPPEFLKPILQLCLIPLVENFKATVVLCTATQPALCGHIGPREGPHGTGGFDGIHVGKIRELISNPNNLSLKMERTTVSLLDTQMKPTSWATLATVLQTHPQVLCIVNTRKDCRELHSVMPPDTIHLSALMCGEHRSRVIRRIKDALKRGQPIRVISTQLVEAGVDLDFPVVFRAMAGLDSIAQAAGRCNREGLLTDENGNLTKGSVVVFQPPKQAPPGLMRYGEDSGKEMFRVYPDSIASLSINLFSKYFHNYFGRIDFFDKKGIVKMLAGPDFASCQFQFRSAATHFKLINEQGQKSILVWDSSGNGCGRELIEQLKNHGPKRAILRKLQRYTVNIHESHWKTLLGQRFIEPLKGENGDLGLWAQCVPNLYDQVFGLRLDGPEYQGDEYIC